MESRGEIKCKEEMEVNIVEYADNNKFQSYGKDDPDATEYSSSFADSMSDLDHCSGLSEGEVEMQMFDENGYASPFDAFSSELQKRKKKLTNHWRSFIRPLMWRCKWTELRIREIESQSTKYARYLEAYEKRKLSKFDPNLLEEYGSKSYPFNTSRRKKPGKRRKRKKIEEENDVTSYMTRHNLFSYLENKGSDLDSIPVADDLAVTEKTIDDDEKYGNFNDDSTLNFRDGDHSLEQILSKIEGVHSRLHKLKNQMDILMSKHGSKFSSSENLSLLDTALSPASDGEVISAEVIDNPAKDGLDYEAGEVEIPESVMSSYDEVVVDIIENTVGLLAAAEVNLAQSQIGDSGECMIDRVLMDQSEGAEEDKGDSSAKATALDDRPGLKSCLASDVNFPTSKRKRGERKAGSGSWKKRRSSEPDSQ